MSNDTKRLADELYKLTAAYNKKKKESTFLLFKPYPKQKQFLNNRSRIRCLLGGNRCLGVNTIVEDAVTGERKRVGEIQEPFHVWAWDGTKRVVAKADKPFVKGFGDIYEIRFSDGTVLEVSANHLLLTPSGWREVCELARPEQPPHECVVSRLPSSLDIGQLVHDEDVLSFWRKALGSQSRCSEDSRPCGGPPHRLSASGQDAPPSQDGARARRSEFAQPRCDEPSDAPDNAPLRSRACHTFDHRPSYHASPLLAVPVAATLYRASSLLCIPHSDLLLEPQLPPSHSSPQREALGYGQGQGVTSRYEASILSESGSPDSERLWRSSESLVPGLPESVSDHLLRSSSEVGQRLPDTLRSRLLSVLQSYHAASLVGTNSVVQINYLRKGEIWDFSVEGFANYFTTSESTVLNHNSGKTVTGSFEIACHATGLYPDWWRGIRFNEPPVIWVIGESASRVRDTLQAKLIGDIGKWGTGMIPKDCILWDEVIKKAGTPMALDIIPIKHINGKASIQFFSYDQGRDKLQGSAVNFALMDEEPPEEINNEVKMRILDTNGYVAYCFTPLSGLTPLYDGITRNPNIFTIHLTWDDVEHLDKAAQDELTAGMSEEEIQARKYGVATIGTGKVIQFDESDYTCPDFEIPRHWPEISGLDVGLTHPTGAVRLRHDEESDIVYCVAEYKVAGKTAIEHCAHLKPWNTKFALSKDAFNKNLRTGDSTADVFKEQGLDVIPCDMSKGSLDASIHELRARIGSGRFFIFKSCNNLLDELRTWRANDKGLIVKLNDDVISALRYALMKLDKAEIPSKRGRAATFTVSDGSGAKGGYAGF